MTFATTSVFDVLAMDDTDRRVASRSALALAHTRVETHLGSFLKGAVTNEEFDARLAVSQEHLDTYVAQACEECGHDKPEYITASLIDHYRNNRRWQPRAAGVNMGQPMPLPGGTPDPSGAGGMAPPAQGMMDPMGGGAGGGSCQNCGTPSAGGSSCPGCGAPAQQNPMTPGGMMGVMGSEGKQGRPLVPREGHGGFGDSAEAFSGGLGGMPQEMGQWGGGEICPECGQSQHPAMPHDHGGDIPTYAAPAEHPDSYYRSPAPEMGHYMMGSNNPAEQEDTSNKAVTCPECGGSKKTANGETCPKCDGKGKVRNFGDSTLDKLAEAQNNLNMTDPEPKMDKRRWTPQNVSDPDESSKMHPNKRKDVMEPIIMGNRDQDGHDLSEIGEGTTEHVDLPAAGDTDHGFYNGGQESGPHTKSFPKGDQASPVTHETQ